MSSSIQPIDGPLHRLTFYFDPISPYAYLAFAQLPEALLDLSYSVSYKPLVFAGLLKHYGQLGPAEIAPKRAFTFRQVEWLAAQQNLAFTPPAAHPFNPVGLMRVALLAARARGIEPGAVSREIAQALLTYVWTSGETADDAKRLSALAQQLGVNEAEVDQPIKDALSANGQSAIAAGVFGVPTIVVDDKAFWGQDSLAMLRQYLDGSAWFANRWDAAAALPQGVQRKR